MMEFSIQDLQNNVCITVNITGYIGEAENLKCFIEKMK